MIALVFVGWLVSVNALLYFWYRRARRKRRAELIRRQIEHVVDEEVTVDATSGPITITLPVGKYDLTIGPRDVAELRELVDTHRARR